MGLGLALVCNALVSRVRASVSDISAGGQNSSVIGISTCSLPVAQAGFGVTIQVGGTRRGGGIIAAITVTTTKSDLPSSSAGKGSHAIVAGLFSLRRRLKQAVRRFPD
jgi:hypothetical protein